eukprot:s673_g6.t2
MEFEQLLERKGSGHAKAIAKLLRRRDRCQWQWPKLRWQLFGRLQAESEVLTRPAPRAAPQRAVAPNNSGRSSQAIQALRDSDSLLLSQLREELEEERRRSARLEEELRARAPSKEPVNPGTAAEPSKPVEDARDLIAISAAAASEKFEVPQEDTQAAQNASDLIVTSAVAASEKFEDMQAAQNANDLIATSAAAASEKLEVRQEDTQAAQSSDAPRSPPGKGKGPTAPARGKGGKPGKGAGKGTDQGEAGQARNEVAGQGQKGPPLPAKGAGKGAEEGAAGRVIEVGSLGRKLSLKSATGRMGCLSLLNQARSGRPTRVDPTRVDFDTMLTTFAQDRAPPRAHVFMRRQPEVKILPDALAQNLGIVLKTLGADTHKAVVSFVFLDNVLGFDAEVAGRLKDAWPDSKDTQKQIQALHDYVRNPTANIAGLREIDRQMMLFALIPRLLPRIRIFCMMNGLEERKTEAFRKLRDLSTTLNRLRTSETLKHIIAVVTVLYNYINHETHPDAARQLKGVDISSLAALRNTKCNTGVGPITNYNMLHFAIQQMLQQDPTRTLQEFQDDVRGLRDHKGLKWETCMQAHLLAISLWQVGPEADPHPCPSRFATKQEDFSFVQRELSAHFEAYFDPDMELFEVALKAQPFAEVMLSHPYGEQVVLGIHSAYGEAYNTAKIFQSRLTAFFGSYTSELRILQRDMRAFVQHFGMKAGRHKTSPHTVELTTALLQFTDQVQSHWQDLLPKPKRNPSKSPRTSRTAGPSRRLSRTITRSSTEDTIPEEDTE